jgi:hypothetical protein
MVTTAAAFSHLSWAVLVGINHYESADLEDLTSPVLDVTRLASTLTSPNGCALLNEKVFTLTENTATKKATLDLLQQIVELAISNEIVIIYFAGHSILHDNDFFLCTAKTNLDNPETDSISSIELDEILRKCKAQGVFLVADCCFSAGLAEKAPNFFRELGEGNFRILLSASRASERSWEMADGKGTLFTNALILAISGEEHVSDTKGQVYFGDLLDFVQLKVSFDLEVYHPLLPKQEPVFAGVFVRDPLLFVHRGLTLEQVSINTARYSREYIRRLVRRALVGTLVLILFFCGVYYTILEQTQYVLVEQNAISIFRGHPSLNISGIGFPKKIWTLGISPEMLVATSLIRNTGVLVGNLGHPVLPVLVNDLTPSAQALLLIWQNPTTQARQILRQNLMPAFNEGRSIPQGSEDVNTILLLATIATSEDVPLLIKCTSINRTEVIGACLQALARLDQKACFGLLRQNDRLRSVSIQGYILDGLSHPSPDVEKYLSALLSERNTTYGVIPKIIQTCIRLQQKLSVDVWYKSIIEGNSSLTVEDIVRYNMFIGGNDLKQLIVGELANQSLDDQFQLNHLALAYSTFDQIECIPKALILENYLKEFLVGHLWVGVAKHCEAERTRLWKKIRTKPELWKEVSAFWAIDALAVREVLENSKRYDNYVVSGVIEIVGRQKMKDLIPTLRYILLNTDNTEIRKAAIESLRELGDKPDIAYKFLNDNELFIQASAYLWYADAFPKEASEHLLNRFSESGLEAIPLFLGTNLLTQSTRAIVLEKLNGSPVERENASIVLAMQGTVNDVGSLLSDSDPGIRAITLRYVAYNRNFKQIVEKRKDDINFPNNVVISLNEQLSKRNSLEETMSVMPQHLKTWYANLIDRTQSFNFRDSKGLLLYLHLKMSGRAI